MRRATPLATAALLLTACSGASSNSATSPAPASLPRTRAERTDYKETSSYADVMAFVDSLTKLGAPISVSELAKSPMGKSVPLVVASRPRVSTPAEARALGRPIVYVQANIHAGEVEGKEAVLALLREWSFAKRPNVLDSLVVVVVPIYNSDGNDKLAAQARNRGAQNGPEMIGERSNGAGLDLNRDYVKVEAPETAGSLKAFAAWNPDLFMDLHTTNGSYHGYALTYSPSLHPAAPLAPFTADTLLPEIRRRMKAKHGFETFPYGNFTGANGRESLTAETKSGWVTYEHKPRYGTNYFGLRGAVSILSEAYSHDPFDRRVASTRAFVQEVLSCVAADPSGLLTRVKEGRQATVMPERAAAPIVPLQSRFTTRPDTQPVIVERLERVADSTALTQPGVPRGLRRTGQFSAQRMPVVDRFEGVLNAPLQGGYLIEGDWPRVRELLTAHGIPFKPAGDAEWTVREFVIDSVVASGRPFQGHREVSLRGQWRDPGIRRAPAGSIVVMPNTGNDLLTMLLLDPQSDDGFLTWNLFDSALAKGKAAPVVRLLWTAH